jgi:hypothetical protein
LSKKTKARHQEAYEKAVKLCEDVMKLNKEFSGQSDNKTLVNQSALVPFVNLIEEKKEVTTSSVSTGALVPQKRGSKISGGGDLEVEGLTGLDCKYVNERSAQAQIVSSDPGLLGESYDDDPIRDLLKDNKQGWDMDGISKEVEHQERDREEVKPHSQQKSIFFVSKKLVVLIFMILVFITYKIAFQELSHPVNLPNEPTQTLKVNFPEAIGKRKIPYERLAIENYEEPGINGKNYEKLKETIFEFDYLILNGNAKAKQSYKDYYKILGLDNHHTLPTNFAKTYRKRLAKWHPDTISLGQNKDVATAIFQLIRESYEFLFIRKNDYHHKLYNDCYAQYLKDKRYHKCNLQCADHQDEFEKQIIK